MRHIIVSKDKKINIVGATFDNIQHNPTDIRVIRYNSNWFPLNIFFPLLAVFSFDFLSACHSFSKCVPLLHMVKVQVCATKGHAEL